MSVWLVIACLLFGAVFGHVTYAVLMRRYVAVFATVSLYALCQLPQLVHGKRFMAELGLVVLSSSVVVLWSRQEPTKPEQRRCGCCRSSVPHTGWKNECIGFSPQGRKCCEYCIHECCFLD
ncbi:MAG TPA: hypothetical protein VEA59_07370 [Patescibacteria group bacterium]|nr:hypothetical protein [Patescibacteria group bacterium]